MRIVFFGTPELALPSLDAVHARHDLRALVSRPDRPQGRSKRPVPPPAKEWALNHGIEVCQPAKLNDGTFEAWLKAQAPDICAVAAYGRILKQPLLDVPSKGFINVHPSLLPQYRGPSPIQTAILNGDCETGVTIMSVDAGMDTGDILLQKSEAILPEDTSATLSERLARLGAELLVEGLDRVAQGQARFTPQDPFAATVTKKFEKRDGRIQWDAPASAIVNLIRAALPWPVAHSPLEGQVFRIHRAQFLDEPTQAQPGTVVRAEKDAIVVASGEGLLSISKIQPPGKRPMDAADFLRGHGIPSGARFGDR